MPVRMVSADNRYMRINKYLAECGIASRRASEQIILDGRVKLNGKTVTELATDVKETDTVTVDGRKIAPSEKKVYIMLHKPKGCVCTVSDELGRKTVMDLLDGMKERVFPVGRLDFDTEGLLLLTNDGDLANRITHPRNEISKTYIAKIEGEIPEDSLEQLRRGVMIDGKKTNKAKVVLVDFNDNISRIRVTISEGRNRQVRRMFEAVGKEVIFLKRERIGDLKLGGLSRGKWRYLTDEEINYLKFV